MRKIWNHPSWQLARRQLRGRLSRSLLLSVAVALSSALVCAIGSGMNTMRASVEYRIDRLVGSADVRVVHDYSGQFEVDEVRTLLELEGVVAGGGRLGGSLTLVRGDGRVGESGRPVRITVTARGSDIDLEDRFAQIELEEGRLVASPEEIVIDPLTSSKLDVGIGDVVRVQRFGTPIELEVVGIQKRPILGAFQKPLVQLSRSKLVEAIGGSDRIDVYSLILDDSLVVDDWVSEHGDLLEEPLILEATERISSGFDRQVEGGRVAFVFGSVIGFLACSIIVATGMTTALVEQQQDLAICRLIGAGRAQLFLSQILLGVVLSLSGGIAGIPIGLGLALGLSAWFAEFLPGGFQVSWIAIGLALAGATMAGVLGAMLPAFLASRVTPISALTVQSRPATKRGVVTCSRVGTCMIGVQLLLMLIPETQTRFWFYSLVGMPMLVGGFFLLMPGLSRLAAPLLGRIGERLLAIPDGLLSGAVHNTPYRLGLTAGALMIGMSILVSTWSHGSSILDSIVERVRFADAFVFKTTGLSEQEVETLSVLPGVKAASPIGYLPLRLGAEARLGIDAFAPQNVICVGFEPVSFMELNRIEWIQGDPEVAIPRLLEGDAVLVAEQFLTARDLGVGDPIQLGPEGREKEFEIVGVVGAAGLDVATQIFGIRSLYMEHAVSCVFMDYESVARNFNTKEVYILQLVLDEAVEQPDEAVLQGEVSELAPGALFSSGRAIKRVVMQAGNTVLGISSTVALGALLLACFAVGNVVAA
ncbi:MAG: ABC transporter permease, partial [Planctomycetota bacterium]|nr:ABC transporter permease [Planctomycetota bacterium]